MALINRISRLVKADFHAVLDHIEEPGPLLRQAMREMEDELALAERRIARRAQDLEVLAARRAELEAECAASDAQLDLCFASQKDDLARKLIRRKLLVEKQLKQLQAAEQADARLLDEQRRQLAQNRAALKSLQQQAALVEDGAPGQRQPAFGRDAGDLAAAISDDEVEIAFLAEQHRRAAS